VDSWITALTPADRPSNIRHPHWGHPEEGNQAREGHGETRPRTGRVGEDRTHARGAQHDDAGGGSPRRLRVHPQEGYLGRQREPLPTRVEGLPPLPDDFHAALEAGLTELALDLRADQRRAIEDHVRLLTAWNAAINLTAIRAPADVARLHVIDSLTAVRPLVALRPGRLLDLGSGGGFPGLPLAVALDVPARLVDSVAKKARFLDVAAEALGRSDQITAEAARAEAMAGRATDREAWPVVTARAVAPLAELVELAFPLLLPGGALVAWKRGDIDDELAAAARAGAALGGADLTLETPAPGILPGHRLVLVTKAGATPPGWPRDAAMRRRRPW
jgi:16S rRNA (guanine527-N7)-methyltransferase